MSGESPGRLVVVGTPIGNLGDWSQRAQQALVDADLVACEDTRRTGSLLARHGIANPGMVVTNEHTERRAVERILEALAAGEAVALVSDAGMPAISDPGAVVVAAVAEAGFEVVAVPGPTAVSTALSLSGFTSGRWVFEGFLPRKGRERTGRLADLAAESRIVVIYEAPHRIRRTLDDLAGHLSPDRRCVVARELTKLHESVWRGPLRQAAEEIGEPRGEYVIVIDAAPVDPPSAPSDEELLAAVELEREQGASTRDAVDKVAARFGAARRHVYSLATGSSR